jgi:hypothetical protein
LLSERTPNAAGVAAIARLESALTRARADAARILQGLAETPPAAQARREIRTPTS